MNCMVRHRIYSYESNKNKYPNRTHTCITLHGVFGFNQSNIDNKYIMCVCVRVCV